MFTNRGWLGPLAVRFLATRFFRHRQTWCAPPTFAAFRDREPDAELIEQQPGCCNPRREAHSTCIVGKSSVTELGITGMSVTERPTTPLLEFSLPVRLAY